MKEERTTLNHEKKIVDYQKTIDRLKKNQDGDLFHAEIKKFEEKLEVLKKDVYSNLSPWERVMISRHPERPRSIDYVEGMCDEFVELHGDRLFRDDLAVVGGFATIGKVKCVVIGQEKGSNTQERLERNFGMLHPEGFRKALRLMKLAEKFHLPVVTFLDTPGAYPGLEAEERGQGWAIAKNLLEMARLATPIVVVVIGEGCSGGALGMGVGDVVGMLEHAYYSVISPEGCASILWGDPSKNVEAAVALRLNAEHLLETRLIDEVIREPLGGAHCDRKEVFADVRQFILEQIGLLGRIAPEVLVEQRYLKFRGVGVYDETEGKEDEKSCQGE